MNCHVIDGLVKDHRAFHSEYQMDHFITGGNNATPFAMYRQALREFTSRISSLKQMYLEEERKEIDLDEALHKSWWRLRGISRLAELDLIEKRMVLQNMRYSIAEAERELVRFYAHCVVLKEIVGELTEERRAKLDAESWIQSAKCRAAAEAVSQGFVSKGTVEMVASMPVEIRKRLWFEIFDDRQELLKWYVNFEPVNLESQVLKVLAKPAEVRRALESMVLPQVGCDARAAEDIRPEMLGASPALSGLTS